MPMAAPVLPPPLRAGDRLTRDEFLRRWEAMPDLKWAELIDGIVYMASPVSTAHGDFQFALGGWLWCYVAVTPGCAAGSDSTWLMGENSVPQPDLAMRIRPEHGGQSRGEHGYSAGAPELIVEVSHTTGARDTGSKLRLYERSGVREYIIVRPDRRQVTWRELGEGQYREIAPDPDGLLRSRVFPGLWLDPDALWKGDFQALSAAVQRGVATPELAEFARKLAK